MSHLFKLSALLVFLVLVIPAPVFAFSISPLKYIFTLERGQDRRVQIKFYNKEKEAILIESKYVFVRAGIDGLPIYDSEAKELAWVQPEWDGFILESGQSKEVNYKITVPAEVYPGDYYFGLGGTEVSGYSSQISIGRQLLSLVNIKVAGIAVETLRPIKWESEKRYFFSRNQGWNFNLELESEANVEMPLDAELVVRDRSQNVVFREPVMIGKTILPASKKNTIVRSSANNAISFPGLYQADLILNFGLTKQKALLVDNFWFIPSWLIVIFGIVLVLSLLVFLLVWKKNRKG